MFPIHYVKDMFSPANIFYHRHLMTWWKSILVMVVWSIIMTWPFARSFEPVEDGTVNNAFEELQTIIPEETVSELSNFTYDNGAFQSDQSDIVIDGVQLQVVIFPSADNLDSYLKGTDKLLLILPDQFVYQTDQDTRYTANLPLDLNDYMTDNATFIESLRVSYQTEVNTQSKQILVMTRQLTIFILGLGGLTIIVSRLNILQKNKFHDLFSFQYCLGMVATAMGLPAIIAIIVGFYTTSVSVMIPILWVGTIVMLCLSYRQTKFIRTDTI